MRWGRGGVSGRSDGGCKGWWLGWVCVRGFFGCGFMKGMDVDDILLGRVNGCELGASDGVFLGNFEWTLAG